MYFPKTAYRSNYHHFLSTMSICNWPEAQRPREKLIRNGATTLSDAELLAIFLQVGAKGKSAVALGNEILEHFGSLRELFSASLKEFTQIHGLGMAKYSQIQAIRELARRALAEDMQQGIELKSPALVKNYLRMLIGNKAHESFTVLFLDVANRLIQCEEMFHGGLTNAKVYPREIIKRVLHHNAASVILAHNHPSGEIKPSQADIALTKELTRILESIEVHVLDHFIVAENDSFSFAEHGML